jgi:hypothetical protein|tara:strand:- start:324 stop:764 length:441 start_codon:yes stop_codon:yes gene_type:complete
MIGSFNVVSVKEVEGFVNGSDRYPNQYNSGRVVDYSNSAKSLLVRGILNGIDTSFFSPSVIVKEAKGYVNYSSMKVNDWFLQTEGETISARGNSMFDNGPTPNVAIKTPSTITPKISKGDVINISYQPKGEFNGTATIKSVKIKST